jgi:hypothetical protein
MSDLRRRLKKLEAHWTDSSGLVPNSPKWFACWREKLRLYTIGQLEEPIVFPAGIIEDWIKQRPNIDEV